MTSPRTTGENRYHAINGFSRSFFAQSSILLGSGMLVSAAGAENYSLLFLYATIITAGLYMLFAFLGERQIYSFYILMILAAFAASAVVFAYPGRVVPVYLFATTALIFDLVGTTTMNSVLQSCADPAVFRGIYQKFIFWELLGRILAAIVIGILGKAEMLNLVFYICAAAVVLHFFSFIAVIPRSSGEKERPGNPVEVAAAAFRFILRNELVRIAMIVMIWTHVTKFFTEYLFYQGIGPLKTAAGISSFASFTSMSAIICALLFQQTAAKKMLEKMSLSALLSILPTGCILLASAVFFTMPLWPLTFLMIFYQVVNRGIQLPVSRQCLVPVPVNMRSSILSLIAFFMAIAGLLAAGGLSLLKNHIGIPSASLAYLFISATVYFFLSSIDSSYIRNLWGAYRERRHDNLNDNVWDEVMVPANIDGAPDRSYGSKHISARQLLRRLKNETRPRAKARIIFDAYLRSSDENVLTEAVRAHKALLEGVDSRARESSLILMAETGLSCFKGEFSLFAGDKNPEIQDLAQKTIKADVLLDKWSLSRLPSLFQRKLRVILPRCFDMAESEKYVNTLAILLNSRNVTHIKAFLECLYDPATAEIHGVVFKCITAGGLTLAPVITEMRGLDYADTGKLRKVLEIVGPGGFEAEIISLLRGNIATLENNNFSIWRGANGVMAALFRQTLFLEEWRLAPGKSAAYIRQSISDMDVPAVNEKTALVEMHMEFLKKSPFVKKLFTLMSNR